MAQITEASERPILKSKIFLYITEFFSGMSADLLHLDQGQAHRLRGQRRDLRGHVLRLAPDRFAFWETNLPMRRVHLQLPAGQEPLRPHDPVHQRAVRRAVRHDERQRTDRYVLRHGPGCAGARDNANSALILGMGTGTYARQLKQYYPKMNITGVEIDQKITDLAGEYFDEPPTSP